MSESEDDIPRIELEPDDYWENNEPRERRSEDDLADTYLRRLFENYSDSTLRQVLGDEYESKRERYESLQKSIVASLSGSRLEKMNSPPDYEKCDDALLEAHEKAVQWKADQSLDEFDISKAPGIWESQDQVPDWVIEALRDLIRSGEVIWRGGYERLPPSAEAEIERILEDRLTQPQGWSLDSLLRDLKDHYPEQDDKYLLSVLRNETSAVLNTAREEAYEQRDDSEEYVYDWIGPNDFRTTDTCLDIEAEIEDRGGAVPMPELKQILYEKAVDHAGAEGTPERVDDWQPHHQCRRTFVRRVQTI